MNILINTDSIKKANKTQKVLVLKTNYKIIQDTELSNNNMNETKEKVITSILSKKLIMKEIRNTQSKMKLEKVEVKPQKTYSNKKKN